MSSPQDKRLQKRIEGEPSTLTTFYAPVSPASASIPGVISERLEEDRKGEAERAKAEREEEEEEEEEEDEEDIGNESIPGSEDPDDCCLFLGDLARGLTEEQLRKPFEPFDVVNVEIKRDRVTQYSLGYGFAQFKSRKDASRAKKALHRTQIGNRVIRIGWAQKNTNLFVGDLDPSITSEVLRETFRKYGPIYEEETFVKHRNYGFVRYKHRKNAERAKKEMDGKILGTRPIRIGWGDANYQRYCVHIQFDPEESENLTESEIIEKFEEFGTVSSVNLPRTQGVLRGFGFIYYDDTDEGEEAANNAIKSLNNQEIGGTRLQCNFGKKPSATKRKTKKTTPPRQTPSSIPPGRGRVSSASVNSGVLSLNRHRDVSRASDSSATSETPQIVHDATGQPLYPVQVMLPVGIHGSWQAVQYMMTAQQARQFYQQAAQYHASTSQVSQTSGGTGSASGHHHHSAGGGGHMMYYPYQSQAAHYAYQSQSQHAYSAAAGGPPGISEQQETSQTSAGTRGASGNSPGASPKTQTTNSSLLKPRPRGDMERGGFES